jgi:sugar phosphate isomerase/epimerase
MRTISLAPLTVLPCSPLDQIEIAAEVGFSAVSLRLFALMDGDVDVMADRRLQSGIRRQIEETRLSVLDVEAVRVTARLDVGALVPALEFAGSIGARRFAITPDAEGDYSPATESVIVRRIADLCDAAARYDVGVMLEFMAYRSIRTLVHAAKIVAAVGHPGLGITIDALHLFRSGGAVEEVRDLPPQSLACLQLCDAPANPPPDLAWEARNGRRYPGEGDFPLVALLRALPPGLPLSVEVPSESNALLSTRERAQKAMASLRSLDIRPRP